MIPAHMLPHDVTVVHPATAVDAYGDITYDYGGAAQRVIVRGWVQQDTRLELVDQGGEPQRARWMLVTNSDEPRNRDRIEWLSPHGQIVFSMDGQPAPLYTPAGYHHTEIRLREVSG